MKTSYLILGGLGALALLGVAKAGTVPTVRPRGGLPPAGGRKGPGGTIDPSRNPIDYPEPPIPGDVAAGYRMPPHGWSKVEPPLADCGTCQPYRDSKGYWWLIFLPGRGGV